MKNLLLTLIVILLFNLKGYSQIHVYDTIQYKNGIFYPTEPNTLLKSDTTKAVQFITEESKNTPNSVLIFNKEIYPLNKIDSLINTLDKKNKLNIYNSKKDIEDYFNLDSKRSRLRDSIIKYELKLCVVLDYVD
ncbi:MAG: hypothetical protein GY756_21465 [bacterium]|nr:hypothetical protein [bacterium]